MKKTIKVKFKGQRSTVRPIKVPAYADPLEAAFYLSKTLKQTNPVDTGRSRRAWTIQEHDNGNITVYNKVHYVQYLEKGHSKQAPNGFIEQAISKTRRWIRGRDEESETNLNFTGKSVDRSIEASTLKILKKREARVEAELSLNANAVSSITDAAIAELINNLIAEGKANNTLSSVVKRRIRELLISLGVVIRG